MARVFFVLIFAGILSSACNKKKGNASELSSEQALRGTWILKGTDGSGPGGTLTFSSKNNKNILSFDCSGSPGPNWPAFAETEYKFENDKLSYRTYYDMNAGFFPVTSFVWIVPGKEFEVKRHQILLYMSADYTVRYVKK